MRICMVVSTPFPPGEGISFYTWNLSRQLVERGHRVQIITRGDARSTSREVVEGVTIWRPPFLPAYPFHVHAHGLFMAPLIRHIEADVDIFHFHSPLVPTLTTARPLVLTVHSPVWQDARLTKLADRAALLLKLQAPVSYQLENKLLRRATKVNVVSPQVRDSLLRYPSCPSDVHVMWNGVDTKLFYLRKDKSQPQGPTILTVGRLAPGKGHEDLLRALCIVKKSIHNVRLVIAGDGVLMSRIRRLIAEYELADQVDLLGQVSDRRQLAELYRSASIFVLASHHEGLPTVLLEAMSCGTPSIATAVGGVPSVLRDSVNGMLVPAHSPQKLAEAIVQLLSDPERQQCLSLNARRTVEEAFSWEAIADNYIRQYEELTQLGSGRDE